MRLGSRPILERSFLSSEGDALSIALKGMLDQKKLKDRLRQIVGVRVILRARVNAVASVPCSYWQSVCV